MKKRTAASHAGSEKTVTPAAHRFNAWLSLPECSVDAVPYMELHGDMSLSLAGYESLLLYEERCIMFRMKPGAGGCFDDAGGKSDFTLLRITGRNLTIHVLRPGCLSVRGRISAVILHGEEVSDT